MLTAGGTVAVGVGVRGRSLRERLVESRGRIRNDQMTAMATGSTGKKVGEEREKSGRRAGERSMRGGPLQSEGRTIHVCN